MKKAFLALFFSFVIIIFKIDARINAEAVKNSIVDTNTDPVNIFCC